MKLEIGNHVAFEGQHAVICYFIDSENKRALAEKHFAIIYLINDKKQIDVATKLLSLIP